MSLLVASLKQKKLERSDVSLQETSAEGNIDASSSADTSICKPIKVKRARKGAPQEVSSRRTSAPPLATHALRHVSQARDPRFNDMSGNLDLDLFHKSYAFLEEYRQEEIAELKKEAKTLQKRKKRRVSLAAREEEVVTELRRLTQQDKQRKRLGELEEAGRLLRRQEREKVRMTGKKPYFHKAGDVRAFVNEQKQKTQGKKVRDTQSERREKKLAAKEKKRLPTRRGREE
mmetsp:Transcript_10627/g.17419  ORF Transcript_10627/g.17419 Transcript_10627/m.17419 type:complete len:231 (-) Transcript_10627:89-781(-)